MKLPKDMKYFDQVSYRYASILFLLPIKIREILQKELVLFLQWIDPSSEQWKLLTAVFLPDRYQKIFLDSFCKAYKCSTPTMNFLEILMRNDRLTWLSDILMLCKELEEKAENKQRAYFLSATFAEEKNIKTLKKALSEKLGKQIILYCQTEENLLLGGIILWEDFMVDASLAAHFEQLKKGITDDTSRIEGF